MPHVLFINHTSAFSGAERVMLDWASRLVENGYGIYLGCPAGGRLSLEAQMLRLPCFTIASGVLWRSFRLDNIVRFSYFQTVGTWQLVKLIRKYKIHVLHANSFTAALYSVLAARLTRRPLVWHMHNIMAPRLVNRLVARWLANNVAAIICVSKAVQSNLVELGISTDQTEIIYNIVQLKRHSQTNENTVNLRDELSLPKSTLLVGMVGQIATWKGQEIFLRAAAHVLKKFANVRCVVIGDVLHESESGYRESLYRFVKSAGIQDRVIFAGYLPDVSVVLPQIDVLVHASVLPDPLPTILLEGLDAGCCIVASRIGGVPEIIAEDFTGLLVTPGSVEELAEKLEMLLSQPRLRNRLVAQARVKGQPFNAQESLQRMLALYSRIAVRS